MENPANKRLKINKRLFRRIQHWITKFPEAFDMSTWNGHSWRYDSPMRFNPQTMKEPICGSACCIAGWAVTLGDGKPINRMQPSGIQRRAQKLLGLTDEQACAIFTYTGERAYLNDVTPEDVVTMIDRFLADPEAPIKPE